MCDLEEELDWGDIVSIVECGSTCVDLEKWDKRLRRLRRNGGMSSEQHHRVTQTIDLLKWKPKKEEVHEEFSKDCINIRSNDPLGIVNSISNGRVVDTPA